MNYDLHGKKPTAPEGNLFRRKADHWRPIVDLCADLAPKESRACKDWYGSDPGYGLNAKQSERLAQRLEQLFAGGQISAYSNRFVDFRLQSSEESIREFASFLKTCGGFQIM